MGRDCAELSLGPHGQPQGRRHPSPRRLPQCGEQHPRRQSRPASGLSLDAADVPLQRLVLFVDAGGGRRDQRLAAPGAPKASGRFVPGLIAGAAPPVAVLEGAERIGIKLTHVYGLTEVYGPASVCAEQPGWDELPADQRAQLKRRQGVPYPLQEAVTVIDPTTMREVPRDGETVGEVMFRGNIVMKGYLKNEKATQEAFAGGWFHTGDLGVLDEHGYVIIKDRSKDIIISGGENISSVEVEDILYKPPAVLFAAVVAKPDSKWGEVPCAFVELKENARATEAEIIAFCRDQMPGFKTPKAVVFGPIPKTSTGKIQKFMLRQEVQSAKAIWA